MKNLDKDPGFWLAVLIMLPFIVAIQIGCWYIDVCEKIKNVIR